jgi:hypothetical protein
MEPRGCNQWQSTANRLSAEAAKKEAKSVAIGCHRLLETFHGKEGSTFRVLRQRTRQEARREFTDETTAHPALIPHEAPGDPRRHPQIPARRRAERPAPTGNPRLIPLMPEAP